MTLFERYPGIVEVLISLAMLAGSYLGARFVSYLFGKLVGRAARKTAATHDDRLVVALKRPVTYALFLVGAYAAVQRLPIQGRWGDWLDGVLFASGALLLTLALLRSYSILVEWFTHRSHVASAEGLAQEFGPLASKLGKVFIVLVAVIAVLQRFNVNVASLVVSLGVGSLAVGLAAQDTLANMFAGFTLMLDRPFKVGDRIQLASGEVGDVERIGMRATRIRTLDETILVVPNAALIKERVANHAQPGRQITERIRLGVAYGSDLAEVRRILGEAVLACEHVARERAPVVLVSGFGDFAVHMLVIFWVTDYTEAGLARSAVHEEIYSRLRDAGIEIPFPVQKVIEQAAPGEGA
jgi:small-conductance mechanosensitive channel